MKPQSLLKYLNLTRLSWNRCRATIPKTSNVLLMASHFYRSLLDYGYDGVKSWTAKRSINIFEHNMVLIPICVALHWSLCVVVNPGAILKVQCDKGSTDDRLPCMLLLDSAKAHNPKKVHFQVLMWLNEEWRRLKKDDDAACDGDRFTEDTFRIIQPVGKFASFNHVAASVIPVSYSHNTSFLSPLPNKRI